MSDAASRNRLTVRIFVGILLAFVVAFLMPTFAVGLSVGGEIFLSLLKMIVVPLVVASVMSGILNLGDVRKLGKPGGYTILYYLATTFLAVVTGLVLVNLINPGVGVDSELVRETTAQGYAFQSDREQDIWTIVDNLMLMLVTDNLVRSAAETEILPLIVFSIIFAGMLTTMGERVDNIKQIILEINDALLAFVLLLMEFAPVGIFCLVAARFGEAAAEGEFVRQIGQTGWYVVAVLGGLAFHAFVSLPLILWLTTRRNPFVYMLAMSQAILTAFSTASSSATLPVTMESAVDNAGVSKRSVEFVLPLGATINMDGTALYEAVAAIFIAQCFGYELGFFDQSTVALTATLAAVGAAGIPEAGLFTMVIVLEAVGLPKEGVAMVIAVDPFLDRFRTAVNVFGDSAGAAVVERSFDAAG